MANSSSFTLPPDYLETLSFLPHLKNQDKDAVHNSLVWRRVSKTVESPAIRVILKESSGYVFGGSVVGILGSSGCGKTTLLSILGGRALEGVRGEIFLGGKPFRKADRHRIAYVAQDDMYFPSQSWTIQDQLLFTAHLRLSPSLSPSHKLTRVNEILHLLSLSHCSSTPLLLASGGEKKRCSIGSELLSNPSCILVDEGTSGLDSQMALAVILALRRMAREYCVSVIVTIHQPSSILLYSFDSLLILHKGGTLFWGGSRGLIPYLSTKGHIAMLDVNPADFVLELISLPAREKEKRDEEEKKCLEEVDEATLHKEEDKNVNLDRTEGDRLVEAWSNEGGKVILEIVDSSLRGVGEHDVESAETVYTIGAVHRWKEEPSLNTRSPPTEQPPLFEPLFTIVKKEEEDETMKPRRTHYSIQFRQLYWRSLKTEISKTFTTINVVQNTLIGIVVGILWFQRTFSEHDMGDLSGYSFFNLAYFFFVGLFNGVQEFIIERPIIQRERQAGLYNISAYFLAKFAAGTPLRLVYPFYYFLISFPLAIQPVVPSAFFACLFILLLSYVTGESTGSLISTMTSRMDVALSVSTIVTLGFLLLGGFYVKRVILALSWLRLLSPFLYCYDASVQALFLLTTKTIKCGGGFLITQCAGQSTVPTSFVVSHYLLSSNALREGTHEQLSIGENTAVVISFNIFFRVCSYLALRFLKLRDGRK